MIALNCKSMKQKKKGNQKDNTVYILSIRHNGTLSADWKRAIVVPLHKGEVVIDH